jgi:hypothetical protein
LSLEETALGQFGIEMVFFQSAQNSPEVSAMVCLRGREDKDVIKVDNNVWKMSQHLIHLPLEMAGRIAQAERHHSVFIQSFMSYKGCLVCVAIRHSYLVVARLEI